MAACSTILSHDALSYRGPDVYPIRTDHRDRGGLARGRIQRDVSRRQRLNTCVACLPSFKISDVAGAPYTLTISSEGLKLVRKGKRNGYALAWTALVSG